MYVMNNSVYLSWMDLVLHVPNCNPREPKTLTLSPLLFLNRSFVSGTDTGHLGTKAEMQPTATVSVEPSGFFGFMALKCFSAGEIYQ